MSLPLQPVMTKFFANKIESSSPDWPDYLLEIANIFAEFDGEELDRDRLLDRFRTLSDRSPYALRDPSNFRDEFGAYGTYLGIYHVERCDGQWVIALSGTARQYLCTSEPDVEAFCRAQLSLFQYPNGAGVVYTKTPTGRLSVRVQANILADTLREVSHGVRLVPFRMICKALLAKSAAMNIEPQDATLEYPEILALANDSRTNTDPSPSDEQIVAVLNDVQTKNCPPWLFENRLLTKFKRNFHIFTHTGLISRTERGLNLNIDTANKLQAVEEIANMNTFFSALNACNVASETRECVETIIKSPEWGRYYDASNLPARLLTLVTGSFESDFASPVMLLPREEALPAAAFPPLSRYESSRPSHKQVSAHEASNPEIARLRREKANRDHARLVERFAAMSRLAGGDPHENLFIDLFVEINNRKYIFEMKSCNSSNQLAQVRKGISQLYEYRYRSGHSDALLCLVLQCPPSEPWLVDYLVKDRGIFVSWLTDDVNIQCPSECREAFQPFLPG